MHVASAFSCLEMVDCCYHELMDWKDRFIMSKGHGWMAQFAILEERDGLKFEGLGAHPDYGTQGIQASTGSLGHGLGMSLGLAYPKGFNVYCLLSDGELYEGSTWEAVIAAHNLKVSNLIALVDYNGMQSLEKMPEDFNPASKFRDFGWEVYEANGHDEADIYRKARWRAGKGPCIIICKTVKGKGVSYMENEPIWHYRSPNPEEYAKALSEI